MRMLLAVVVGVALFIGAFNGIAGACSCGDRDGCGSSLTCTGKDPDDACAPPKGGTCQVVKGFSGVFTCCCACRRGNAGAAAACAGFGDVKASLATLKETGATCGKGAKPATRAAAAAAATTLGQAQKACQRNNAAKEDAKIAATNRTFSKLDQKIEKLLDKNKVTQGCRDNVHALVNDLIIETKNAGTTTEPAPTTTTTISAPTTTTTFHNPPNISCNGNFFPAPPPYATTELDYIFSCPGSGPSPFNGFGIVVTDHSITNKLDPNGFTCQFHQFVTPNDGVICNGIVTFGSDISGGRLHFSPPFTTGMGAVLDMYTDGSLAARYNITGP